MASESTKIAAYGPFTVTFKDASNSTLEVGSPAHPMVYSGLKFDSATFSLTTKEGNVEFEDGSESYWEEGRTLEVEITISEMVTAEMDKLELAKGLTLAFSETGKTITVAGDAASTTIVSVDNFKTVIRHRKFFGADTTIANCLSIA